MESIISIKNLGIDFNNQNEVVKNINIEIVKGKTTAIVGESGSGKTVSALSILKLLPNNANIKNGEIIFNNQNILSRQEVIENLIPYVKNEIKKGTRMNQIMRHTLGLFHGQTGSSYWKKYLSENMCVRDADVKKIDHIMDKVKLAPQMHQAGQID